MGSKYIITNGTFIEVSDELYHRKTKRRYERKTNKSFKYIAKVDIGKSTRYFYTKAEYDAYLNSKKSIKEDKTSKTKINGNNSKKKKKSLLDILVDALNNTFIGRLINLGKRVVEEAIRKTEEDERKAKEEAERKAKEEAERKAKEEAERKAKEEAERKAKEEAERKAQEEAERKAQEEFDKQKASTDSADAISEANSPKSFDELKLKDREYTKDEDQAVINTNYISSEEAELIDSSMTEEDKKELKKIEESCGIAPVEYTINCQSCTLAYDLRQRGYDVEAAPYDDDETWQANLEGISEWYEGVTEKDWTMSKLSSESLTPQKDMYDKVTDTFNEMPNGSYGQFCIDWSLGGGHSMVWEKENGKVTIRDCQTNEKYSYDEIHLNDTLYNYVRCVYVLRTDDKKITNEALKRVRNTDHVEEIDKYIEKLRKKYGTGKE